LKALVWEDASRTTWLSYNEPSWIVQRHRIQNAEPVVNKMMAALRAMSRKVTDAR
jgi:uncharacterized protein (DUF302 family)